MKLSTSEVSISLPKEAAPLGHRAARPSTATVPKPSHDGSELVSRPMAIPCDFGTLAATVVAPVSMKPETDGDDSVPVDPPSVLPVPLRGTHPPNCPTSSRTVSPFPTEGGDWQHVVEGAAAPSEKKQAGRLRPVVSLKRLASLPTRVVKQEAQADNKIMHRSSKSIPTRPVRAEQKKRAALTSRSVSNWHRSVSVWLAGRFLSCASAGLSGPSGRAARTDRPARPPLRLSSPCRSVRVSSGSPFRSTSSARSAPAGPSLRPDGNATLPVTPTPSILSALKPCL